MLFGSCMTLQLTNYPHMTPLALGNFLNEPPPPSQIIHTSHLKKIVFRNWHISPNKITILDRCLQWTEYFPTKKSVLLQIWTHLKKNLRKKKFLFNNQPTPFSFIFFSGPLLKPVFFAFQPTTLPHLPPCWMSGPSFLVIFRDAQFSHGTKVTC